MIPGPPTRETLDELVAFAQRRAQRAVVKLRAAQDEVDAAETSVAVATENLLTWIRANPDPQIPLPIGD